MAGGDRSEERDAPHPEPLDQHPGALASRFAQLLQVLAACAFFGFEAPLEVASHARHSGCVPGHAVIV